MASKLLRDSDRLQCCIGIMCSQLGATDKSLVQIPALHNIPDLFDSDLETKLQPLIALDHNCKPENPCVVGKAYMINDDTVKIKTDAEREKQLINLFKTYDIELEFKTKSPANA